MAERPQVGVGPGRTARPDRAAELESLRPSHRMVHELVDLAVTGDAAGFVDRARRQHPHPIELTTVQQHPVERRDRSRSRRDARGRDHRLPHDPPVEDDAAHLVGHDLAAQGNVPRPGAVGQAELDVAEPERCEQAGLDEGAHGHPRDPLHEFAEHETVGEDVVSDDASGRPPGCRVLGKRGGAVPVGHGRDIPEESAARERDSRPMREHVPNGDALFPVAREFGPVQRDGVVQPEHPALDEQVHGEGDERFADRERPEQGFGCASEASVEHDLSVAEDAELGGCPDARR